jgi:hypothetical protein
MLPPHVLNSVTLLALTTTHMRHWSYQNAQFFPDGGTLHRELITLRLSVETSYLVKELCISTATARVT